MYFLLFSPAVKVYNFQNKKKKKAKFNSGDGNEILPYFCYTNFYCLKDGFS